jgi:hypothetical protein
MPEVNTTPRNSKDDIWPPAHRHAARPPGPGAAVVTACPFARGASAGSRCATWPGLNLVRGRATGSYYRRVHPPWSSLPQSNQDHANAHGKPHRGFRNHLPITARPSPAGTSTQRELARGQVRELKETALRAVQECQPGRAKRRIGSLPHIALAAESTAPGPCVAILTWRSTKAPGASTTTPNSCAGSLGPLENSDVNVRSPVTC